MRVFINFFFLQGKVPKEIQAILTQIWVEHAPPYATVKNPVCPIQTRWFFHLCCASSRMTQTCGKIGFIDQIIEVFGRSPDLLQIDSWASHVSGLGPSFMKFWRWGSSPFSWSRKARKRIENVSGVSRLSKFVIISLRPKWFPVAIGDHRGNLVIYQWSEDKVAINRLVA